MSSSPITDSLIGCRRTGVDLPRWTPWATAEWPRGSPRRASDERADRRLVGHAQPRRPTRPPPPPSRPSTFATHRRTTPRVSRLPHPVRGPQPATSKQDPRTHHQRTAHTHHTTARPDDPTTHRRTTTRVRGSRTQFAGHNPRRRCASRELTTGLHPRTGPPAARRAHPQARRPCARSSPPPLHPREFAGPAPRSRATARDIDTRAANSADGRRAGAVRGGRGRVGGGVGQGGWVGGWEGVGRWEEGGVSGVLGLGA